MTRGSKLTLIAALGGIMLCGCVSIGPNFDPAAVAQLQPGMAKQEVIARLGKPTSTATLPDGQQQLMWIHSRGDMLGRGDARSVTLMFGPDGRYRSLVSQAETNLR